MQFHFSDKVNNFLKIIAKSAKEQKKRIFFAGGLPRDAILNLKSYDIDILVMGNAIEFVNHLPPEIKLKSIHKDFYTAKVEFEDLTIDFASTREESYPYSGSLPKVNKIGVDLALDVKRRDFSVNSLYCEIKLEKNQLIFELIDLTGGIEDIKNKSLRVLHDLSYKDDPTRILRGVGFKHRFGFDFSSKDKKLIDKYLDNIDRTHLSFDRTAGVVKKILSIENNFDVFLEITEKKYYRILFPEDLEVEPEKVKKTVKIFDLEGNLSSEFYFLILENGRVDNQNFKDKLDIYNYFSKLNMAEIAYFYYKTGSEAALDFIKFKNTVLFLKGRDLINLGFKPGKIFSEIIEAVWREKLEKPENFSSLEQEINWVKKHFSI